MATVEEKTNKPRKKPRRASRHACHFYEEALKSIGFMGFIGKMATQIDFARNKAATALFEAEKLLSEDESKTSPPKLQYETVKTLQQFDEYVSSLVYIQIVDQANYYLGNVLRDVFLSNPKMLKSGKQMSMDKILSFANIEELHVDISEEHVQALMYKSIRDLVKYLKDTHGVEILTDTKDLDFVSDCNLKRNLIVHNSARVNKIFLQKCSSPDSYVLNSKLNTSIKETYKFIPKMVGFVLDVDRILSSKFKLSQKLIASNKFEDKWASFLKIKKRPGRPKVES